jgi:hypothetical protein
MGCHTILIASEQADLTGFQPEMNLSLPSGSAPRLLETSLFIGNQLCALVEGVLFGT